MEDQIFELMELCLWILRLGTEAARVDATAMGQGCQGNGGA